MKTSSCSSSVLLLLLLASVQGLATRRFMESVLAVPNTFSGREEGQTNKLQLVKTGSVKTGPSYTLACRVQEQVRIERCSWGQEGGQQRPRLQVVKGEGVATQDGAIVTSLTNTWCNMTISSLSDRHFGRWSCQVEHSGSRQFQAAFTDVAPKHTKIDVRLPTGVRPSKYHVYLVPFIIPDNFTIAGHVQIEVEVLEPVESITVHIYDMTIHEKDVTLVHFNGDMVQVAGHAYDEERQFYIVQLAETVQPGSYRLDIPFTGVLNNDLAGFYRSRYTDQFGNEKYIATTQFEATDARRAFPCFDEPAMKAVFQINLGRTKDMSSISNMPIKEEGVEITGTEYVWDIYQDSLKMSTYLVAFVISDFVHRKSEPQPNNVEFRIWSREGAYNQTELAADVGPRILAFYEEYFNTSFPLPKQDMIAIPDFSAGAMENWGLVTYREVALLYQKGISSLSDKEYVAVVIAHELAHQWFGDLVTMEWWTDLWLNEGFASYTEYIGTDHVDPDSAILDRFIVEDLQPALELDALETSHPISVPVNVPDEINEIFDTISYQKGAAVIRMMANFLQINTFNRGISNYLHSNSFSNANQDTLWEFLTDAALEDATIMEGLTVKDIMDTWTLQMGYPVIAVTRNYDNSGGVVFKQERFLINPKAATNATANAAYRWWVPLSFATAGDLPSFENTSASLWMAPDTDHLEASLPGLQPSTALIVNAKQTGFYRVNYDAANWALLAGQLGANHEAIHRMNRAQLLDDAFNLARAGLLEYTSALELTSYLSQELDFIPWTAALNGFAYIEKMFKRSAGFGSFRSYVLGALQPVFDRLGFDEQPDEDSVLEYKLRVKVLKSLCNLNHPECTATSVRLFAEWRASQDPDAASPVPSSSRQTVLCTAIQKGTVEDWDFLWSRYLRTDNANEKNTFLGGLACSQEDWVLERFLGMALDESSGIRKQDAYRVVVGVAQNTIGRYIAWNWLRTNWKTISATFDTAISSAVGRMIQAIANDFNTEFDYQELETFIQQHEEELGSSNRTAHQMLESTRTNIDWMATHYQTIADWLKPPKRDGSTLATRNDIVRRF